MNQMCAKKKLHVDEVWQWIENAVKSVKVSVKVEIEKENNQHFVCSKVLNNA